MQLIEDIEIVKGPKGFGFSIAGGVDTPLAVCSQKNLRVFMRQENDFAIYITQIVPGGAAEEGGRLQLGDKVC